MSYARQNYTNQQMLAMQLQAPNQPLTLVKLPIPTPDATQLLIKVIACAICRTDLHIVAGELPQPHYPLIPGHQIVGTIVAIGKEVSGFKLNQLVGVPWLGGTCGCCNFCLSQRENLCDQAKYTGYHLNGGFAEYCVANASFCFRLPLSYSPLQVAPLLCAGLIGYRSYKKLAPHTHKIALYGFGAAAHIITQVATYFGKQIYAITKPGDQQAQNFALQLGAVWSGSTLDTPPCLFDGAIIYASSGELVPLALSQLNKGAGLVCAGIHMSDIPSFKYELLWGERTISSVANLTYQDGIEFLELAPKIPVSTHVNIYRLAQANQALADLDQGKLIGSGVIVIQND